MLLPATSPIAERCRERTFRIPAKVYARLNTTATEVQQAFPLGNGVRLPPKLNAMVAALVVGLLLKGGPNAIVGLVMPVVVDSLDTGAMRTRAHVPIEVGKIGKPFGADLYAASTIVRPMLVFGIEAASSHAEPSAMLWRSVHAVSSGRCSRDLRVNAATAKSVAALEVSTNDAREIAAVAPTQPAYNPGVAREAFGLTQNSEPSKGSASQINLPHTNYYNALRGEYVNG